MKEILTLTDEQVKYIKNKPAGEGLICFLASKKFLDVEFSRNNIKD